MKDPARHVLKLAVAALALVLVAGIVAPYLGADRYGERLRGSLERALGRRVEFLGPVRFSLFKGPGFSVENVVIHEDPSIGIEPMAYMDRIDVTPGFWSLLGGKFVIASIRLEGASINLAKSGAVSEWGRWNFASLVNPSVLRAAPAIHVATHLRDSRINFKFGDESRSSTSPKRISTFRLPVRAGAAGGFRRRQTGPHRPSRAGSRFLHREGALVRRAGTRRSGPRAGPLSSIS